MYSNQPLITDFKHGRSSRTLARMAGYNTPEQLKIYARENEFNGRMTIFPRPFGCDIHISLFDAENTFFISCTGGHFVGLCLVESQVDGPIKILLNEYSHIDKERTNEERMTLTMADCAKGSKEKKEKMFTDLKALLKDSLPSEAFNKVEELLFKNDEE